VPLRNAPIRRKLSAIILLTCGIALLLTCAGFFATELITFRRATVERLATIAKVVAANSTAALAFKDQDAATEILSALKAEPSIVGAGLLDRDGGWFAIYPAGLSAKVLPAAGASDGYRFEDGFLIGVQPVEQGGNARLGTLVLKSEMTRMYQRLQIYAGIAAAMMIVSLLIAYLLSRTLQEQISRPIRALADAASAVSDRRDYSVRAARLGNDELGVLTDAFNHMLTQIQSQHQSIQDSEARVRAVLNSALSAVIVMEADGRVVDWNSRAEAMFGWKRDEAVGMELAELIIPRRLRLAHRRGLERYLTDGEGPILNRSIELTALRRDGSEFPVEISISPVKSGATVSFCGFITDITERQRAQEKIQAHLGRLDLLNRITRAIGDRQDLPSIFGVVIRSLEDSLPIDFGCVFLYDPIAQALTVSGLGAASTAVALEMQMLLGTAVPVDQNGLARCVLGTLVYEADISQLTSAFSQRLSNAGLRSLVIAPLLAESRVFGVLTAARREPGAFSSADCEFLRQLSEHVALASHQAHLHTALQQAYDDLHQSQKTVLQQERLRALGQMASGVAHDINNAISPIALYTESLLEREPNLSERARNYLTTIQRAIEDVAETVARMREFYRPREPQLALGRVDLNRVAGQVIDLTQARWRDVPQERGFVIELETDLAAGLPAIMGAESEIRDALTNLIFNAVDAMPEGGTLTIRTRVAAAPEQSNAEGASTLVSLDVGDTGVGMDEETRRHCLEPFYTTKGERGTGLGLAMVYGMVQRHSAELDIESRPGSGTTVSLTFAAPAAADSSTAHAPTLAADVRRQRILVVDDDPIIIESLRDILEGDGHIVAAAGGGRAGIDIFTAATQGKEPFGVVITDLGMPYIDGRQVAAAIKAVAPDTPVILLTGWGQRLLADNDIPPHVDRVLNKPPKLRELRQALAELSVRTVIG
jgi:PAS domain S-box-containing protein